MVCFLGLHVLLQERETTAEGVRMKGVVWITEVTSLVRCAVQHLRSHSESKKQLCSIADTEAISFQDLVRRLPHSTFLDLMTQTDAPDDAWEEEFTGWDPRSTRDPSSSSSFGPHQPDVTSRLGPDLVSPSRPVRAEDEMSVQEHETTRVPFRHSSASETIPSDGPVTSVESEESAQTMSTRRIAFKRPPNQWILQSPRNVPGVTMTRILHFPLLIIMSLGRCQKNLKDRKSVFRGTRISDMSDTAWLAIKIKTVTQRRKTTTEAQSVQPLQEDVDNLLLTVSFPLDEETIQQVCSKPDPETALNVMVKRRRAVVKVSTVSAEQKRGLVKAKDKELHTLSNILWGGIASRNLTVSVDVNALGYVQG